MEGRFDPYGDFPQLFPQVENRLMIFVQQDSDVGALDEAWKFELEYEPRFFFPRGD
jgi:hypothetical protein